MEMEKYEMAVTHYLDTVDDEERKTASADAEKMKKEHGGKGVNYARQRRKADSQPDVNQDRRTLPQRRRKVTGRNQDTVSRHGMQRQRLQPSNRQHGPNLEGHKHREVLKMKQLDSRFIGRSLSHATMRPEDLIPSFLDFLREIKGMDVDVDNCAAAMIEEASHEQTEDLLEDIYNLLNAIAPDHCIFGAHEGNGSDYGFWTDEDSLINAIHFRLELLDINDDLSDIRATAEWILSELDNHGR
jgi:hypothetical protein